jgi:hypothetical protein
MRTFVFLIGSMDEFESVEELESVWLSRRSFEGRMASAFKFDLPVLADPSIPEKDFLNIATLVGRGLAFESWTADDTLSALIEVE